MAFVIMFAWDSSPDGAQAGDLMRAHEARTAVAVCPMYGDAMQHPAPLGQFTKADAE